ncbi:MAG: hypothetical protein QUU85_08940, partial [Candidatus Eisenbacteria bacterium]|nr:hypothetical protein [Candidatus Eisenbacteria bacterium]
MPSRAIVVLFCLLLSPLVLCAAPLQVDGLDSLSSATLGRALEILDVRPVELGFDKLYAPDDTFRFAIVEQLLGDPLRLPGWQDEVFAGLRGASGDAAALSTELHGLIEAAPGRGSAAGALQATGSWQRLREGLAAAETIKTWPVVIERTALEPEMARLGAAAAKLERAFARLTPAEREQVLVLAPVIWADWEDPDSPDRNGKGKLHFEVGAAADTSITITADRLLTIATSVDRGALAEASREALDAFVAVAVRVVEQAAEEQEDHPRLQRFDATSPFRHMIRHMKGGVITSVDTPLGPLVVGGPGTNIYEPEALARIAFLIDVGGDDVYRGRVASALGGLTRPFYLVVDASGDDVYDASDRPYAIGSAIFGVAALIDLAGDDQYRGADGSCGAGFFGTGILYDGGGVDSFEGRNLSQGCLLYTSPSPRDSAVY